MLEGSAHAFALHTVDEAGGHLPGEVGVFGVILEIAPTQWGALHVRPGAEDHIHLQGDALLRQCLPHGVDQIHIPGGGHAGGGREAGGGQACRDQVVYVCHAAHAVRPIRNGQFRHAQAFDRSRRPGTGPGTQGGFFFQRHLFNDRLISS